MEVTTRRGKQSTYPPMLSVEEAYMTKDEEVEASEELVDKTIKEAEVSQKVVHVPTHPLPFPQRLVKNT